MAWQEELSFFFFFFVLFLLILGLCWNTPSVATMLNLNIDLEVFLMGITGYACKDHGMINGFTAVGQPRARDPSARYLVNDKLGTKHGIRFLSAHIAWI